MEDGIRGILRDLLQQLADALSFCRKLDVFDKGRIQVYGIECLQTICILNHRWGPGNGVDVPWFASDISSVEGSFPLAFEQEHNSTGTMVGVQQGDLDMVPWLELEFDRGVERKWLQQVLEVLVGQLSSLQDALGIVDAARDGL